MKRILFSFLFLACFAGAAQAQSYKKAIGLRFGVPNSISYKHFLNENGAIEVFGGFRNYSAGIYGYGYISAGALYQYHKPIPSVENLQWYFGGGASAFFWHWDDGYPDSDSNTSFGVMGCLGLDYKFASIPLNLSIDWAPVFFLNGFGNGFTAGYGALSARYVLGGGGK